MRTDFGKETVRKTKKKYWPEIFLRWALIIFRIGQEQGGEAIRPGCLDALKSSCSCVT